MQNNIKVLSIIFSIFLSINSFSKEDFSPEDMKYVADSLFDSKNYTDAKFLYDNLYFEKKIESQDLILKLAYVNEGLKKYEWTLYFLEQFLKVNPEDEKTKEKILKIAENNKFKGFEISDVKHIKAFIFLYKDYLLGGLVTLILILFGINIFFRKNKMIAQILILSFVILSLSYWISYQESFKEAIIINDALLMDSPSAAGQLIQKIKPGHKATILKNIDVWSEIMIGKNSYFIKTSQLKII